MSIGMFIRPETLSGGSFLKISALSRETSAPVSYRALIGARLGRDKFTVGLEGLEVNAYSPTKQLNIKIVEKKLWKIGLLVRGFWKDRPEISSSSVL